MILPSQVKLVPEPVLDWAKIEEHIDAQLLPPWKPDEYRKISFRSLIDLDNPYYMDDKDEASLSLTRLVCNRYRKNGWKCHVAEYAYCSMVFLTPRKKKWSLF